MSTLITIVVKIILAIIALESFFKHVMNSNMVSILLFIWESDKAGREYRKRKKNDKANSKQRS